MTNADVSEGYDFKDFVELYEKYHPNAGGAPIPLIVELIAMQAAVLAQNETRIREEAIKEAYTTGRQDVVQAVRDGLHGAFASLHYHNYHENWTELQGERWIEDCKREVTALLDGMAE